MPTIFTSNMQLFTSTHQKVEQKNEKKPKHYIIIVTQSHMNVKSTFLKAMLTEL